MSLEAPEVFADLSKNLVDAATLRFLADLARECGIEAQRDAMLAGAPINNTERPCGAPYRAARAARRAPFGDEVHAVLDAMLAFAESVRERAGGAAPGRLRHVVNIGIGGSDLGPQMAVRALAGVAHPGLRSISSPTSTAPTWPRCSPASPPTRRSSSSPARPSRRRRR